MIFALGLNSLRSSGLGPIISIPRSSFFAFKSRMILSARLRKANHFSPFHPYVKRRTGGDHIRVKPYFLNHCSFVALLDLPFLHSQ